MAKLTKIIGYGEYKLGMKIAKCDLTNFKRPESWNFRVFDSAKVNPLYMSYANFKIERSPALYVTLGLFNLDDTLEAVIIEFSQLDKCFRDIDKLLSFVRKLRHILLDKYSPRLLVKDTIFGLDGAWRNDGRLKYLTLKDNKANMLSVTFRVKKDWRTMLSIAYTTALFRGDADESKL